MRWVYEGESAHSQVRPARQDRQRPHGVVHDERDEPPDLEVAGRSLDARPQRLDDAGALVAHHDRARPVPVAVPDVQVRVADARRQHPDPNLARARLGELQLLDPRGDARLDPGPRRESSSLTSSREHNDPAMSQAPARCVRAPLPLFEIAGTETKPRRSRGSIRGRSAACMFASPGSPRRGWGQLV